MISFILGFGRRNLKRGDKGDDVAALQTTLELLGISVGVWDSDGIFGPDTEKGVKEYQSGAQLKVDGIVGPMTRHVLEGDVYGHKPIAAVDLSQHNRLQDEKINWALIERNVGFLILRCGVTRTEIQPVGIGIDADFAFAAGKCREFNIPYGCYYYGKVATAEEGRKEADMCWDTASPHNPLFYVYDVEEPCLTNDVIEAWVARMRSRGAQKLGLYIGHHVYPRHRDTVKSFDFIWIPRYGKDDGTYNGLYNPNFPCDLHQFTSKGRLPGLRDAKGNTDVDLNRLTGSKPLKWFLTR